MQNMLLLSVHKIPFSLQIFFQIKSKVAIKIILRPVTVRWMGNEKSSSFRGARARVSGKKEIHTRAIYLSSTEHLCSSLWYGKMHNFPSLLFAFWLNASDNAIYFTNEKKKHYCIAIHRCTIALYILIIKWKWILISFTAL